MSEIAGNEQCFGSGRYSKRKRTQVTYCMEEMDVSDSEADFEHVQTKKRKATKAKALPKHKVFPFMELPSELRNMIYGYCLEDPAGINFVATFKHKRRTVERVSQEAQAELGGRNHYYHASRLNDSARAKYEEPVALTPALLAVSKQIHQEARDILYNNELIFADSFALYNFLINVGPDAAKQIKHLRIMGWGWGRAMKAYNHSCFAVLAWATNVETLHLDKTSGYSRSPKSAADQLYRDAFPWLEAIGVAKGKVDAGVDVLEFDDELFDHNYHYTASQLVTMGEDKVALFRETLRKLLGAQQKRLMASPVKKRKTAKIAADDEE